MRLSKARIQNYRSIHDTGWFDVEKLKTIFVGSNEAGKTAILQAIQQINPPKDVAKFDPLRDYPRSKYNDISTKKVDPANVVVVDARFSLEEGDINLLGEQFAGCAYSFQRRLDNSATHDLVGGPEVPSFGDIKKDLLRLAAHLDSRVAPPTEAKTAPPPPSQELGTLTEGWPDTARVDPQRGQILAKWLEKSLPLVDESNQQEEARLDKLRRLVGQSSRRDEALNQLFARLPVFVLFNNYFRVRPLIHLEHLAQRIESKILDDAQYDYGNECLLRLLGFTARDLSNLGKVAEPPAGDGTALQKYRDQLDKRAYQLNAASVRLTNEIREVWAPDLKRDEADRLRIQADGQYLKVVVEDDLGVEIELNQRSEGFQWLVSFFVVFFAEAAGKHENAVLLLDEPGMSLHGLKQREFRITISKLAQKNQTLYTTHCIRPTLLFWWGLTSWISSESLA